MKKNTPIDTGTLLEEAKASEHGEAYRTLERSKNYRIGVGVRLTPPKSPFFFVEVIISLCSSLDEVDLDAVTKSLACLKKLEDRNYALTCQDGNYISCELTVTALNLIEEFHETQMLIKESFSYPAAE
jgi:hypothetical protein